MAATAEDAKMDAPNVGKSAMHKLLCSCPPWHSTQESRAECVGDVTRTVTGDDAMGLDTQMANPHKPCPLTTLPHHHGRRLRRREKGENNRDKERSPKKRIQQDIKQMRIYRESCWCSNKIPDVLQRKIHHNSLRKHGYYHTFPSLPLYCSIWLRQSSICSVYVTAHHLFRRNLGAVLCHPSHDHTAFEQRIHSCIKQAPKFMRLRAPVRGGCHRAAN